jgi:type I restriction enzyme, S subunit
MGVDLGDLLISASASMGTVSEVTEETTGAVPYTGIIRIKPGRMHQDFIRWFVVSGEFIDQVDSLKTGSTIQHFGPTHLAQMRVALPPIDEQRRIAAYLDEQVAKIDTLIEETERFIDLSRERRSAVITAVVTGQIDVREVA